MQFSFLRNIGRTAAGQ